MGSQNIEQSENYCLSKMIMGDIYSAYGKPEEKQENNAQTVV